MGKVKRPSLAKDTYNNFSNLGRDRTAGPNFNRSPAQETSFLALNMYRRHLSELAINRFKWMGLPDSVDPRFLEVTLFQTALSVFYFDRDPRVGQFVSLRAGALGRPNMMDNPTAFRVFREPLPSIVLTAAQCVPVWANTARIPDHDIVEYFSRRMSQWDTTIEINGMNARQTKIISSDENSRLTMMNVNRQIVEGEPAIYVSDKQNIADSVAVLDLSVDALHLEKLSVVRSRIWSECMGMLGINSASTEKKERVTDDEVDANDDQVQSARNVALNSRKLAAHKINKRFGLAIEVEYNQDIDGELNSPMQGTYVPGKEISQ